MVCVGITGCEFGRVKILLDLVDLLGLLLVLVLLGFVLLAGKSLGSLFDVTNTHSEIGLAVEVVEEEGESGLGAGFGAGLAMVAEGSAAEAGGTLLMGNLKLSMWEGLTAGTNLVTRRQVLSANCWAVGKGG
jgi:hypothetical protein